MTSFNYMDNVPVKISERYKPPPRLYQLPQAIQHKLLLSSDHFQQAPQYTYDFQLERKVLAKIPVWRRMRQQEREARRERKEKREQLRLKEVQAQQRQLLGAVSYPDAEELSSTDSDDESQQTKSAADVAATTPANTATHNEYALHCSQISSFHNILQPTILTCNSGEWGATVKVPTNGIGSTKLTHAFNYKEFENDTSSPFDNIELKTINDLDILAQVLHNTQLKTVEVSEGSDASKLQLTHLVAEQQVAKENEENLQLAVQCIEENSNANTKDATVDPNKLTPTEHAISANVLEGYTKRINLNGLQQQLQNSNIPDAALSAPMTAATSTQLQQSQEQNNHGYLVATTYTPYVNATMQGANYMPYTLYNGMEQPSSQYTNFDAQHHTYANQNYLYANGLSPYYSPTHATQIVGHNANNYVLSHSVAKTEGLLSTHGIGGNENDQLSLKSKSVPDILKELRDEVRNSELRRTRNNSHSLKETDEEVEEESARKNAKPTITTKKAMLKSTAAATQYYSKLAAPARKLAKNISSMGFPLERVAKVTQMFGTDDKKIIEHLIPLSELVDLGFDEVKISEALMKCDNNKEKAIEYLIS